jgi:hypothetical protein
LFRIDQHPRLLAMSQHGAMQAMCSSRGAANDVGA